MSAGASALISRQQRALGAILSLVMLLVTALMMGRAATALMVGLVIAYAMWIKTAWSSAGVLPIYLAGLAAMILHFAEEYAAGFHRQFPGLFGQAWTGWQFAAFNAIWFAVFVIAAIGVRRNIPLAYLAVLFFALVGGIVNGVGHLLLCVALGRYFPGAATAPLMLAIGVLLLRRLYPGPASNQLTRR